MFIKILEKCGDEVNRYSLIPVDNIDFIRESPTDEKRSIIYLKSKTTINCLDRIHGLELTLSVMTQKKLI